MNKKFCPTCGNASLLRSWVSVTTPEDGSQPILKVHLKKNFQFRTRGTKYAVPSPKSGSSKTGPGEGLILREDQSGWMRAEKREQSKRRKDEAKLVAAMKHQQLGDTPRTGTWQDPDWVPETLTVGPSGKGRMVNEGLPDIGYGRRNPNERRKRRK